MAPSTNWWCGWSRGGSSGFVWLGSTLWICATNNAGFGERVGTGEEKAGKRESGEAMGDDPLNLLFLLTRLPAFPLPRLLPPAQHLLQNKPAVHPGELLVHLGGRRRAG